MIVVVGSQLGVGVGVLLLSWFLLLHFIINAKLCAPCSGLWALPLLGLQSFQIFLYQSQNSELLFCYVTDVNSEPLKNLPRHRNYFKKL